MKHMNYKLQRLLHEGFSISTLEKLTDKQMGVLLEKVKNGETKEETTITSTKYDLKKPDDQKKFVEKVKVTDPDKVKMNPTDDTATVGESEIQEKSVSKSQQGLMGAAYSVEKGYKKLSDIPKSYRKKVKDMVGSMTKKELKDFASTKHKGLPDKKTVDEDIKRLEEGILRLMEKNLPPHTTKGELLKMVTRTK